MEDWKNLEDSMKTVLNNQKNFLGNKIREHSELQKKEGVKDQYVDTIEERIMKAVRDGDTKALESIKEEAMRMVAQGQG